MIVLSIIVEKLIPRDVPRHRWPTRVREALALCGIARSRRQCARDVEALAAHVQKTRLVSTLRAPSGDLPDHSLP